MNRVGEAENRERCRVVNLRHGVYREQARRRIVFGTHGSASVCWTRLRNLLASSMGAGAVLVTAFASAQGYPSKAVRVIVGYPAGAGNDVVGRLVMSELSRAFGQQFIVDNRPGAASMLGTDLVAKSQPDGYTLLLADLALTSNVVRNPRAAL